MFRDFENTKKQLAELADIVNKFKSESVQLKLLELLFNSKPHEIDRVENEKPKRKQKPVHKRRKAEPLEKPANSTEKKKPSTMGAGSVLAKLYGEGFFSQPRTINDICTYADTKLARKIKARDLSGKLARMVRNRELSREKNNDNQYEYTKS